MDYALMFIFLIYLLTNFVGEKTINIYIQTNQEYNNNNNQLCSTRVGHNSQATDKPMALEFLIKLEFRNVDFCGGRKTGEPGEKPSEQGREPTTNSTHL